MTWIRFVAECCGDRCGPSPITAPRFLLVTHNVIEAERSVDRLAILDRGPGDRRGAPSELKGRLGAALRLELVLDPDALDVPASPFGLSAVPVGNRLMVGVPTDAAGQAVAWAESLKAAGSVEEFTLGRQLSRRFTWPWSEARRRKPAQVEEVFDATAA